ncbi:MAG: DNA mismatch repair endonuclease MutL [Gammaproteobacteria bacterium]|nr:DNA mismatch repair endonuclease MutL [Gammaproteobacteria bacterium]
MAVVISRIKPLSLQLANQIAAGEVVERPASVVKELLENAVDARSSRITIDIERGGSALIRVSDDGDGIDRDDLSLAVTRHATSKLHTLTELERLNSLGFRGEALASISAVSKLSIQSKQAGQEQAWMINTGTDSDFANYSADPEPVAHPQGSTIAVCDLFYNTPARRKFMRTVKTEFKHIDDIVKRIALSQFNIAFKLTHNKKLLRNLPKAVTEKAIHQRISKLFSPEFLSHSKKVDFTASHFTDLGTLRLWGWVSEPQWHRNQPDWQFFYVNGRYIKDKLVNHALRQAYQELLPADAYSAYLLYLEIDPEHVDVNVHPTKHEVRFRQARLIHDFIYSALNQAVCAESQSLIKEHSDKDGLPGNVTESTNRADNSVQDGYSYRNQVKEYSDKQHSGTDYRYQNRAHTHPHSSPTNTITSQNHVAEHLDGLQKLYQTETTGRVAAQQENSAELASKTSDSQEFFGHSLGCLIPNYLLSQKLSTDGQAQLFVINILRAQQFLLSRLFHPGQQTLLLIPHSISLTARDIESLLHNQSELGEWGMELSQLTADTMLVRSLPSLYGIPGCQIDTEGLIKHVLHIISLDVKDPSSDEPSTLHTDLFAALLKSLTTHSLNSSEQEQLLNLLSEQINQLDSKQANIDKQPVWVVLDSFALDRLFK